MTGWVGLVSAAGVSSTAVVFGTDVFFLTVGRTALRAASSAAGTEVMGFIHMVADARMPVWGATAVLTNLALAAVSPSAERPYYAVSLSALVLHVVCYGVLSKPINRVQTEAARAGRTLDDARALQASWDRSLLIRVPLLLVPMLAQILVLTAAAT